MKIVNLPRSASATEAPANAEKKATALRAIDEPNISLLTDTETLRVLEVRPPSRGTEHPEVREDADAYAVQIEERFRAAHPLALVPRRTAPPAEHPATLRQPTPAPKSSAKPSARGLAGAMQNLSDRGYELENPDLSSTSGVRHLRIEVTRRAKRPMKPSGGQRKS